MAKGARIYSLFYKNISLFYKLDRYMEENEIRTFSNTTHKNKLTMDLRSKCKIRYYKSWKKQRQDTL